MEPKLSPNIETDKYYYFFTFLSDRFKPLNNIWAKNLELRFNKPFKPIYILPFRHNKKNEEENYIVLNEDLAKLHRKLHRSDIINLIYPEDLNKQFSKSKVVNELIAKIAKKQGTVFVLSFTSVWLEIKNPNVVILGPDSNISAYFDNKTRHISTFNRLSLNTNKTYVYKDFQELRDKHQEYPFFISATFSSGGIESAAIYTKEDLDKFYAGLREINRKHPFIAARLLQDIKYAPNSNAIVSGINKTTVMCISDQILRNNRYMGNIYPSRIPEKFKKEIEDMTVKVGNYLSSKGFRGIFGMDFLITESGKCYPVDLNPRRQGGYFCNVIASSKIDIVDLELRVIFKEPFPKMKYSDFQVNYCWAHSKLSPYFSNMRIVNNFYEGDPTSPFKNIGTTHKAIYYPKNHVVLLGNPGFYVTSGKSYTDIKMKLYRETEEIISKSYELYEG